MIYSYKPGTAASRLAKDLRTSIQYPRDGGRRVQRGDRTPPVNWGVSGLSYSLHSKVLNRVVAPALSKVASYAAWGKMGLAVPKWSRSLDELVPLLPSGRSILARRDGLTKGQGIEVVHKKGYPDTAPSFRPDFFVERLSYLREFRVHVWLGEPIHVQAKVGVDVVEGSLAKNFENGWEYTSVALERYVTGGQLRDIEQLSVAAVEALGLDFGAVDVLINKKQQPFLLEVNTAPGLRSEASYAAYKEALKKLWQIK